MHPEILSLSLFMFVTSCSPGPNNVVASHSGFNHGIKKSIPLMLGVIFGFTTMLAIVNFGLINIFNIYPIIQKFLIGTGTIFLIYLAYKISFSKSSDKKENLKFSDLELIFKDLKTLFEKKGFIINWKELEKQSLDETINALAMASPFTIEEKQVLLEAENLSIRKNKIADILSTYTYDVFDNTTLQ